MDDSRISTRYEQKVAHYIDGITNLASKSEANNGNNAETAPALSLSSTGKSVLVPRLAAQPFSHGYLKDLKSAP